MQINCREEQSWKAPEQIFRTVDRHSKVTVDIDGHPLKHFRPIFSTDDGTQIDSRDINSQAPISRSLDRDSKIMVDIDSHPIKQFSPIFSTDDGMQIVLRTGQFSKTSSANSRNDDPDSKSTRESEQQFLNAERAILTTVFGIQIDARAEQSSNAENEMCRTLESGSNVTLKS
jgi:hypothetical protein